MNLVCMGEQFYPPHLFRRSSMSRTTQRAALNLSDKEQNDLGTLPTSRKAPLREVQRAKIRHMTTNYG